MMTPGSLNYGDPEDFAGVSGGGLWRVRFKIENDVPSIKEIWITGVAYWQSAKTKRDKIFVRCNGLEIIRTQLRAKIVEELGDPG